MTLRMIVILLIMTDISTEAVQLHGFLNSCRVRLTDAAEFTNAMKRATFARGEVSVGHANRELQLPRLIEHLAGARRLQIRACRHDPVEVGQVLGVQNVERLDDALDGTNYLRLTASNAAGMIASSAQVTE